MTVSATASFTVKLAWPFAFVVPLTVVIVELPVPAVRDTVLPLTGLLFASSNVTVIADVLELSAVTDVGLAVTVDLLGLTAPTVKLTVAVCVTVIVSVVSFAV